MIELYKQAWSQACDDVLELLTQLDSDEYARPTDCPGWTVHDVVAHLAHLEAILAGTADETPGAVAGESGQLTSQYTENGVAERRGTPVADLVAEFGRAVVVRREQLTAITDDAVDAPPVTPGGIDWTWDVLLRNRVIDLWVHEQDIRRAIGRPGSMDSPAAHVTATTFSQALPFVLAKKAGAPAGTTVHWLVDGPIAFDIAAMVGDDGRARTIETPTEPAATMQLNTEDFTVLGAGRRSPEQLDIRITGDTQLANRVLSNMPVTP